VATKIRNKIKDRPAMRARKRFRKGKQKCHVCKRKAVAAFKETQKFKTASGLFVLKEITRYACTRHIAK